MSSLEEDIQQRSFKSPQQRLAINLIYTHNWLNNHYTHFFKGLDITIQQFNVLRILRGQYPNACHLKSVKERMLDRMSDASRIVDKLVQKQLVERRSCPSDRRSVNLMITKSGLELLEKLDFIDEASKDMFKNLPLNKIEELNTLLDDLRGPKQQD